MATRTPTSATSATDPDPNDWLGYGAYADALWGRIQTALIKSEGTSAVLGDDPLVIGVFGEWGAGKSKLLSLMQDRSRAWANDRIGWRKRDGGNFGLTVPVYFQPWKYEHEEHLHVPILLHIFAALKQELTAAQTWTEWAGGKIPKDIMKHMEAVVSVFGKLLNSAAVALDMTLPLASRAGIAVAGQLAKVLPKVASKPVAGNTIETLKYTDSGRYFYEIHEALKAVTRPKQHGQYLQGVNLHADLPINFVVFIDDLDRCLPEKAVQTLELIKTIFNAESFAFVLALDEEVIERGIGHRYQAYNFAGKKPEMPITGFEYLEKIVHLPFRLPTVTESQARLFVGKLEEKIAPVGPHWFKLLEDQQPHQHYIKRNATSGFSMPELVKAIEKDGSLVVPEGSWTEPNPQTFDLLALALRGFDAYVPRKLSRLVELWHTTVQVARTRNEADNRKELLVAASVAQVDIRIVLVLLMVQIFHPDLYRVFRRHEETFQTLYNGFDSSGDNLSPSLSDIDLWHWAAYKHKDKDESRPTTVESALVMIARLDDGSRYPAQQKRLPLVECIIAHRRAQRHVFDALKLFSALKQQMPALPQGFKVAQYFSLLAEYDAALTPLRVIAEPASATAKESGDTNVRFNPIDAHQLYLSLIAADAGTQEALVEKAHLEPGKFLSKSALENLVQRVKAWLGGAMGNADAKRGRLQLLNGLFYLAPFIADKEGESIWEIVKDSVDLQTEPNPKLRALWGDVRDMLGCDDRFESDRPYLFKARFSSHTKDEEPIPGFVRIPAGKFVMGSHADGDNPPRLVTFDNPYFISRTLVTVGQYAMFINSGGYDSGNRWWDSQGLAWRNGTLDEQFVNDSYQNWLATRSVALRQMPLDWSEQKTLACRPVRGVNWFEARAYARWLDAELAESIEAGNLDGGYKIRLPTEVQWERAARADTLTTADTRRWPWGNEEELAEQRANVGILVGSVCAVGLYPPSPIGLLDMAGNVWEWMDNLYAHNSADFARIGNEQVLATDSSREKLDLPAVRGGSWSVDFEDARAACRNKFHPVDSHDELGFRVVVSRVD